MNIASQILVESHFPFMHSNDGIGSMTWSHVSQWVSHERSCWIMGGCYQSWIKIYITTLRLWKVVQFPANNSDQVYVYRRNMWWCVKTYAVIINFKTNSCILIFQSDKGRRYRYLMSKASRLDNSIEYRIHRIIPHTQYSLLCVLWQWGSVNHSMK